MLPEEIKDFRDVFSKNRAETLPQHRSFDCKIEIEAGTKPPHGRVYNLTSEEDKTLKAWIDDNLRKGFIRECNSPFASPCFFVKKKSRTKDTKLRLCVDHRC